MTDKKALRKHFKEIRLSMSAEERKQADVAVQQAFLDSEEYKSCTTVLAYVSSDIEVSTAEIVQEILTVKSDDVVGRVKTYEAIIKGENIPEPGIPESFKVLLKELQSLGLDVSVLRDDGTEVEIGENVDYGETDLRHIIEGDSRYNRDESFGDYGYQQQEFKDGELVGVEGDDDSSDDFEGESDDYTDDSFDEE